MSVGDDGYHLTASGRPPIDDDQARTIAYVADMTTQLATLARDSNLNSIAYLLEIVRLEASKASEQIGQDRRGRSPPG